MSPVEKRLVDDYQRGLPLTPRPFADIADNLGVSEADVLSALDRMRGAGVLSRVGAVVRPNTMGASTLVALAVAEERLEAVAALVNKYDEVNHNYEREGAFNLWFVAAAADERRLAEVLADIECRTGFDLLNLPLERPYHLDLGFPVQWSWKPRTEAGRV